MIDHIRAARSAGAALFMLVVGTPTFAQEVVWQEPLQTEERYAIHGQATFVTQGTPGFDSPYADGNSLAPNQVKETFDATLFAGVRPWSGAELWINPEIDQGFGLSNTLGVAGFPSAEAYKVGKRTPYVRLQRLFFRQMIGLGGGGQAVQPESGQPADRRTLNSSEFVDGANNQLAGRRDRNRFVLTVGKIGIGDIFDTNIYAHDPRVDFLNWSIVDAGNFDYAADAWGYSTGGAIELYKGSWIFRAGVFNLSKVPNGETLETGFDQYQLDGEIEHRHSINGNPGAVRVTVFRNRGRFSRFDDAVALSRATGQPVDPALTRERRTRAGVSVNVEQAVGKAVGIFARAGIADGSIEPYDFTDIDRTVQLGASIKGLGWGRKDDTLGIAQVINGISRAHQRYLDAGGLGVLIGDGRLPHPSAEFITEAYYSLQATKGVSLSADYQFVGDPGYNRDRGPAHVFALRLHGAF